MGYLSDEIKEAAEKLGVAAKRLSPEDADLVRRRLAKQYMIDPKNLLSFTAYSPDDQSIHDPQIWRRIGEFVGGGKTCLLFNSDDDADVWEVPNGDALVSLLGETTGFVFYVAPSDAHYLLYYDDHDCLVGLGTAADWIRRHKADL